MARLTGLHSSIKRLADGRRVTYWYAWRGGPRLPGVPGSPEFVGALVKAREDRKRPQDRDLRALVGLYRGSPEFQRLRPSTRAEWGRWLKRIEEARISSLPWEALERPAVRNDLLRWRNTYADRPRTADYGAQVLGRVLAWAVKNTYLAVNHFADVDTLHRSDRSAVIWTDDDLKAFAGHAAPHVYQAVALACETGLRRGDLIDLKWSEVYADAIVRRTAKSGREAVVPLTPQARALLEEIGRKDGHVLLNSRKQPWTADGLESLIHVAKKKAGLAVRLHDARGTFATRLRLLGLTRDEIADVMGWDPVRVERLLSRYVDRDRIVRAISERLANGGPQTK